MCGDLTGAGQGRALRRGWPSSAPWVANIPALTPTAATDQSRRRRLRASGGATAAPRGRGRRQAWRGPRSRLRSGTAGPPTTTTTATTTGRSPTHWPLAPHLLSSAAGPAPAPSQRRGPDLRLDPRAAAAGLRGTRVGTLRARPASSAVARPSRRDCPQRRGGSAAGGLLGGFGRADSARRRGAWGARARVEAPQDVP